MGRKRANKKYQQTAEARSIGIKICPHCTGSDGNSKEIYDSPEEAMQRAEHIKETRGVQLKIYRCEYGNGWHLTKKNLPDEAFNHRCEILVRNGIPLSPVTNSRVAWEFIEDTDKDDVPALRTAAPVLPSYKKPIVRVECKTNSKDILLTGKVTEIIKNVNIEKVFNINLESAITASLFKDFTDEPHHQITVHAENSEGGINSYTVLVKKSFMQKIGITKGANVKIFIGKKQIINKNIWYCHNITTAEGDSQSMTVLKQNHTVKGTGGNG
ncbi:MAG: hypothetical protein LBP37_00720 [Spirochaetaceae bacterium]|jgi:hypothetical protein|nr:hypothetical protein [Spirochaetaceae bacterium]